MNPITGTGGADTLRGGATADLIYGYDPAAAGVVPGGAPPLALVPVAGGLGDLSFAATPDGDGGQLFVVQRPGVILRLDPATGAVRPTPFLDIAGEVQTRVEEGMLGLAFHPDYAANGRFYVSLTNLAGDTEIREYRRSATDPGRADPASGRLLLTINQPEGQHTHKAGWLDFGPDGLLYIASGDGGRTGDPDNIAQNTNSLLGKILRIEVDGDDFPADPARNYAVPADNPFVGKPGADEVWAYGLRNPWRESFDRATGDLFITDVGRSAWEEVNLGAAGANYGWRRFEGPAPFNPPAGPADGLTFPIHAYPHPTEYGAAVIGGYAYRGPAEALHGTYIFGDFVSGAIWGLEDRDGDGAWTRRDLLPAGSLPAALLSFAEDAEGNLYALLADGSLHRLDPQPGPGAADAADRVFAGDGDDRVFTGRGADVAKGGLGQDLLSGMAGDDRLEGALGDDSLSGGAGHDRLSGGPGRDLLLGGSGIDRLEGGAGRDGLDGGAGRDIASYALSPAAVVVNLASGRGSAGDAMGDRLAGIENLRGSIHADRLFGDAGGNLLFGLAGADTLAGGPGDDRLFGGRGADELRGGRGADRFGYTAVADSTAATPDRIVHFARAEGDRIDVSAIDTDPLAPGDQGFTAFIGATPFAGGGARQIRAVAEGPATRIEADADGDGGADLVVEIAQALVPIPDDFVF